MLPILNWPSNYYTLLPFHVHTNDSDKVNTHIVSSATAQLSGQWHGSSILDLEKEDLRRTGWILHLSNCAVGFSSRILVSMTTSPFLRVNRCFRETRFT